MWQSISLSVSSFVGLRRGWIGVAGVQGRTDKQADTQIDRQTWTLTNILGIDTLVLLLGHHVLGQLDVCPGAKALILLVQKLDPEFDLCLNSGLCTLRRDACDVDSEAIVTK